MYDWVLQYLSVWLTTPSALSERHGVRSLCWEFAVYWAFLVCLFVYRINQKVVDGFYWNFQIFRVSSHWLVWPRKKIRFWTSISSGKGSPKRQNFQSMIQQWVILQQSHQTRQCRDRSNPAPQPKGMEPSALNFSYLQCPCFNSCG